MCRLECFLDFSSSQVLSKDKRSAAESRISVYAYLFDTCRLEPGRTVIMDCDRMQFELFFYFARVAIQKERSLSQL